MNSKIKYYDSCSLIVLNKYIGTCSEKMIKRTKEKKMKEGDERKGERKRERSFVCFSRDYLHPTLRESRNIMQFNHGLMMTSERLKLVVSFCYGGKPSFVGLITGW